MQKYVLLLLFLMSCSKQTQEEKISQIREDKISFALDWTPNTNHTGLYVAQKLGYFSDAGLKVDIRMPQSSVTQLVASGRIDFGIAFQEFASSSMANEDVPVVSVAAVLQHNTSGFTAMQDRSILQPRDFAGKLYAGWGNPFESKLIRHLIAGDGGDPEQFASVSIGEASLEGLLPEKVDYAWTYYAWQNISFELQGLKTHFIPLRDIDPVFDFYSPIVITSRSYLAQSPDKARRFMQALAKGYQYASQKPAESAVILLEYAPELDPELVRRSAGYLAPFYVDEDGKWGWQKAEVWNRLSQWMFSNQLIDKVLTAELAMSNELLEE